MPTSAIVAALPVLVQRLLCSLLFAVTLLVAGCGGPRVVPVSGEVTYNGEPLKSGNVIFSPEDPKGRTATAVITNGKFAPTSHKADDGLMPGKYKISVTSYLVDIANTPPIQLAKLKDGGLAIPKKYTSFDTSGLSVTIAPTDTRKEIKLELKD